MGILGSFWQPLLGVRVEQQVFHVTVALFVSQGIYNSPIEAGEPSGTWMGLALTDLSFPGT